MSSAAVRDLHSTFDASSLSPAFLDSPPSTPALGIVKLQVPRAGGTAPAAIGSPSRDHTRTITHVYEPVRDERNQVIDFRLTFDEAEAPAVTRPFLGIHVVRTGDWAAPGEIFHTLKRVLESGQSLHEMTRHVGADQEVCFYQTANRVGDTVVTTTSIAVIGPHATA